MQEPLRIVNLKASNFKRLKVVDITPTTDVVQITGENASGKSSTLDAIFAALGKRSAPAKPIRDGEDQATIQIDLGKYIVYRVFTKDEKPSPIIIRPKEGGAGGIAGKPIRSPQDLLDQMLGELTFDPLAFSRMSPKNQAEELRRICNLGVEIDELDRLNAEDYEERTRVNRMAKESKAACKGMDYPEDLPEERLNVAVLAEEMEKAVEHNASIEKRRHGRLMHVQKIKDLEFQQVDAAARYPRQAMAIEQRRDQRVNELLAEIDAVKRRAESDLMELRADTDAAIAKASNEAKSINEKLASAPPIPDPVDVMDIKEAIANAQSINSGIDQRERYHQKLNEARFLEEKSEEITKAMEERAQKKNAMIAAAKMPVPGLSLEDGVVTYNGQPFEQVSSAEQLRVSVAIAMAANPTLRILLIKDGSLLDAKSLSILSEMASDNGFQVWLESVSDTDDIGIVMEDGAVLVNNYETNGEK